jgi:hypothetical protein
MNDLELMERFRAEIAPPDPAAVSRARAGMFHDHPVRKAARPRWQLVPIAGLAAAATIAVAVTAWPSSGPPAAPDGARLLRLAADEARQEPLLTPRPDQFVFFDTKVISAEPDSTSLQVRTQQMWLSVDGRREGAYRSATVPAVGNGHLVTTGKVVSSAPAYRRDLPTDVSAMREYLYGRTGTAETAWGRVCNLLREKYLPPDTTAALFEAAATIPGITVIPDQVDLAGRPGIAVSRSAGEIRQDLIFAPSTHRLLGERDIELRDSVHYPKGTVFGESAQLRVAIVDRAGQLP